MVSIDVEPDLPKNPDDKPQFFGVEGLGTLLKSLERKKISSTLFVTGEVLENFPDKVVGWGKSHEIASHGHRHQPLTSLTEAKRIDFIQKTLSAHQDLLGKKPLGYRAVQHNIDNMQISILERHGFAYDSSVMPNYPPFKSYPGWKGRAPSIPYNPSESDYRKIGSMKILELPVSPLFLGVPISGKWICGLKPEFYKILLMVHRPEFICINLHSWDMCPQGSVGWNNANFIEYANKLLEMLAGYGYEMASGEKIYERHRRRNR